MSEHKSVQIDSSHLVEARQLKMRPQGGGKSSFFFWGGRGLEESYHSGAMF